MKKIAFNGFLFSQRQTGVMRYACEVLKRLDESYECSNYELVVPVYADSVPNLKKIKIVKYGNIRGSLWEQVDFYKYIKRNNMISVNFNNTFPFLQPGIVFIHDIAYKIHPEFGTSLHGKLSNIYHRLLFSRIARSKMPIITVSYFSKYQLIDYYGIDPKRIHVIGSAWQHFNKIGSDDSILEKYKLVNNNYYFSLGSLSKMKNTKWIIDVARDNANAIFVLAGAKSLGTKGDFSFPSNVLHVGFVSDEEIKSLITHCKAFIYPSIYDGFGLPPLEALSQGVPVVCSNAASLTEVYGSTVHYIDPYNTKIDLEAVLSHPVSEPHFALEKYSWDKSTKQLYRIIEKARVKNEGINGRR